MRLIILSTIFIWVCCALIVAILEISTGVPKWLYFASQFTVIFILACDIFYLNRASLISKEALSWLRSHTGEYANEIHKYITGTAKK